MGWPGTRLEGNKVLKINTRNIEKFITRVNLLTSYCLHPDSFIIILNKFEEVRSRKYLTWDEGFKLKMLEDSLRGYLRYSYSIIDQLVILSKVRNPMLWNEHSENK